MKVKLFWKAEKSDNSNEKLDYHGFADKSVLLLTLRGLRVNVKAKFRGN